MNKRNIATSPCGGDGRHGDGVEGGGEGVGGGANKEGIALDQLWMWDLIVLAYFFTLVPMLEQRTVKPYLVGMIPS